MVFGESLFSTDIRIRLCHSHPGGYLIFGPIGILVVSLTVAFALFVKHRSPVSRLIFNFSNHLLAGTLCTSLIAVTGKDFLMWDPFGQLLLCLISAAVLYLTSTWLIATGMKS